MADQAGLEAGNVSNDDQIIAEQQREIDYLREQNTMLRDYKRGDYWAWQGDGEDHLESLTCPILISANMMRALHESLTGGSR